MSVYINPDIVTDGLVLCLDAGNRKSYPGSGITWYDLSGKGNNATLVNGVTYTSSNYRTLIFDGINDYAAINAGSIDLTNKSFSVVVWFKPTLMDIDRCIFAHVDTNTIQKSIHYRVYSNGLLRFDFFSNSLNFPGVISVNNWYETVTTYDYDIDICKMYLNGQLIAFNSSGPFLGNVETSITYIGTWTPTTQRFAGEIPSTKIYNRVLTSQEVQQNYNALKGRYGL